MWKSNLRLKSKDVLGETHGGVEEKRGGKDPERHPATKKRRQGKGAEPRTLQAQRGGQRDWRACGCVTGAFLGGRKGGSVFGGRLSARGKACERLWAGIQQINKTSKTA